MKRMNYLNRVIIPGMNLIFENTIFNLIEVEENNMLEYSVDAIDPEEYIDMVQSLNDELEYCEDETDNQERKEQANAIRDFIMTSYYAGAFDKVNLFNIEYGLISNEGRIARYERRRETVSKLRNKRGRTYNLDDLSDVDIKFNGIIQSNFQALDDLYYDIYQYSMTAFHSQFLDIDLLSTNKKFRVRMDFKLYIPKENNKPMYSIDDIQIDEIGVQ